MASYEGRVVSRQASGISGLEMPLLGNYARSCAGPQQYDATAPSSSVYRVAVQDFRRLHVWQRAHAFTVEIRRVVKTFPPKGYADLRSQLTRAAESIPSNIVEGCASASRKEFAHHLNVSIKSTSEVDYQLELARDYRILPYDIWRPLAREAVEIRKMLTALRRVVLRSIEQEEMPDGPPSVEPEAKPDAPSENLTEPEETEPGA